MSARGANVCRVHGGSAPQVKVAAKRRLDGAADALVQRLLGFALDGTAPDAVALAAIRDALDRAGLNAKQAIEVDVEPAPWEQVMADIVGVEKITLAESLARRGLPADEPPARGATDLDVVDAELVPESIEPERPVLGPSQRGDEPARPDPTDGRSDRQYGSGYRPRRTPTAVVDLRGRRRCHAG